MTIEQVFQDKSIKAKGKVALMGDWLIKGELVSEELISFALTQRSTDKATCIEALEYATKKLPSVADELVWNFAVENLAEDEPRIKWESAKVIGNVCKLFSNKLEKASENLLRNATHSGTVVRWATAYALAEILKLKMEGYSSLFTKLESLSEQETDNAIKKKYLDALKKVKK